MTERNIAASTEGREPPPGLAGALLRAAREAAGMSVDAVAHQLKLAPRQVKALEEGDFTHLPGRTFVRGFVRNYARLVRLDPEKVLGALPGGASAPTLEAPMLQQTATTMGELPTNEHSKSGWMRWAIPLTLAAIVAAAGMYEWLRPQGNSGATLGKGPAASIERPAATSAKHEASSTSLQNPLVAAAPDMAPAPASATTPAPASSTASAAPASATTPAPASSTTSAAPASSATPAPAPSATAAPAWPASPVPASALSPPGSSTPPPPDSPGSRAPAPGLSPAASPPTAAAFPADQSLMLSFRDYSWTEVRDRNGRVLLSGMNSGGTSQSLSGTPPLVIVIGNAAEVSVHYKGQPVDLAPYMRQNVARFTLR